MNFDTASRQGEPFEMLVTKRKYLPNMVARFCTQELKVLAINRYLKSIGISDYITFVGVRADEPRRVAKIRKQEDKYLPLADVNITEKDVWEFWDKNGLSVRLTSRSANAAT